MSLPSDLRPRPHKFIEQVGTDECGDCSMPFAFGGLHPDTEPEEPQPDTSAWRHDDILHCPGGVYRVVESRYDGLVFVPLEAIADGQSRPPHGATLIVRAGQVIR